MGEIKSVGEMNYFEILAWLGIGSSHPGGFPATQHNLSTLEINPEDLVLDAGCGNGLTACYLAKTRGCKIIGVDLNPQMIENARLRAENEGVSHLVEFRVADVLNLPFPENMFHWVIAESITVFLDKAKVYQEIYRVLKPEGKVADLEMALLEELPLQVKDHMEVCFGPGTNPLPFEAWRQTMLQAGFEDVEIKNPHSLKNSHNINLVVSELRKDWLLIKNLTTKLSSHPGLYRRLQQNAGFTKKYKDYFGFGVVYGRKPTPPPPPQRMSLKKRVFHFIWRK